MHPTGRFGRLATRGEANAQSVLCCPLQYCGYRWNELAFNLDIGICERTLREAMNEKGYYTFITLLKPFLEVNIRARRVRYC
jgi:hypothetical protein